MGITLRGFRTRGTRNELGTHQLESSIIIYVSLHKDSLSEKARGYLSAQDLQPYPVPSFSRVIFGSTQEIINTSGLTWRREVIDKVE